MKSECLCPPIWVALCVPLSQLRIISRKGWDLPSWNQRRADKTIRGQACLDVYKDHIWIAGEDCKPPPASQQWKPGWKNLPETSPKSLWVGSSGCSCPKLHFQLKLGDISLGLNCLLNSQSCRQAQRNKKTLLCFNVITDTFKSFTLETLICYKAFAGVCGELALFLLGEVEA